MLTSQNVVTGIKFKLDPRLKLLNYTEQLTYSKTNKLTNKFVNNILVITKRVIFSVYYKANGSIKGSDILYEFQNNIKLTLRFMSENAIFLNTHCDIQMENMLYKSLKLFGILI